MQVDIRQVTKRFELKEFFRFPYKLYKNNKYWVPPIFKEELKEASPDVNPAFDHCDAIFLIAIKDGNVAGRIACIINKRYIKYHGTKTARFFWFDFINDLDISGALLKEAERWALSKGMEAITGPMGFTNFEKQGVLIEGFEYLPTVASPYNYPYYPEHLEYHGYTKDCDYLEFLITVPRQVPKKSIKILEAVSLRYKLHTRDNLSKKELMKYSRQVFEVINKAYQNIHGFVPLTDDQVRYFLKKYDPVILPAFSTAVLDDNDRLVGFQIAMPSLSKALQKARGKLFPLGFYYISKAIKKPKKIDILLVGVIPEYQNKGVNAFFLHEITKSCLQMKIPIGESNGILEDNMSMLHFTRYYDVQQHKRRRLYKKVLPRPHDGQI